MGGSPKPRIEMPRGQVGVQVGGLRESKDLCGLPKPTLGMP